MESDGDLVIDIDLELDGVIRGLGDT